MKLSCPSVCSNNFPFSSNIKLEHLRMLLDDKLIYEHHLNFVLNKVKKTIHLFLKISEKSYQTDDNCNLQISHSASFRL